MFVRTIWMPNDGKPKSVSHGIATRNELKVLATKSNNAIEVEVAGAGDETPSRIEYLTISISEYPDNIGPIVLALGYGVAEPVREAL